MTTSIDGHGACCSVVENGQTIDGFGSMFKRLKKNVKRENRRIRDNAKRIGRDAAPIVGGLLMVIPGTQIFGALVLAAYNADRMSKAKRDQAHYDKAADKQWDEDQAANKNRTNNMRQGGGYQGWSEANEKSGSGKPSKKVLLGAAAVLGLLVMGTKK